ncbi:hypothetical protein LTR86_004437 [Recurvomyces mirabilis]|nr:hypothetical protein LTR86_004437 [Recurvomyces mirabilis]
MSMVWALCRGAIDGKGIRPAQSRIPETPNQSEFLERWYEFHRGYRIVTKEDGSEERAAVLGEPFVDVDPGCLPRTLDEMRAGRLASEAAVPIQPAPLTTQELPAPSLDDTLGQMFADADSEENSMLRTTPAITHPRPTELALRPSALVEGTGNPSIRPDRNIHAQTMTATGSRNREYQARRVTALRRELHRMRNGIERVMTGLRDLGEAVPDHQEATTRLTDLGTRLDALDGRPSHEDAAQAINSVNALVSDSSASQTDRAMATMQSGVDEARRQMNEARQNRDQAASELDAAESEFRTSQQRLQQLQREQRTTENYMRLFGTREEMAAQGDQYESPIGGMFTRAYERFRAAEDVRQEERTLRRVIEDEARVGGEAHAAQLAELENRDRDVWGVPQQPTRSNDDMNALADAEQEPRGELEEYYALLRRQDWRQRSSDDDSVQRPPAPGSARTTDQAGRSVELEHRGENFPRSMLREPSLAIASVARSDRHPLDHALDASLPPGDDWRQDVLYMVAQLMASELDPGHATATVLNSILEALTNDSQISQEMQVSCDNLLRTTDDVWRTGLPTQRLQRRRARGLPLALTPDVTYVDDHMLYMDNVEIMAEAYQMSADVRRRASSMTPPERLSMLYRLQAGTRDMQDVMRLQSMLADQDTFALADRTHRTISEAEPGFISEHGTHIDEQRRHAARQGDHSRQELNVSRQAASALAVAAGRTAMQTSPDTLLERMAAADEETRAAYDRLRENGWAPNGPSSSARALRSTMYRPLNLADLASPSDTDSEAEEDEEQGLDAKDTGRPEPKTEEEMQVSMECRICYTQLAEVACLPCGHLVMCKWCSEQHSPVMQHDRTRPKRATGCPVCRKGIRQKYRVFRA